MNVADGNAGAAGEPRILFSSTYGGFPRLIWYFVVPFQLIVSAAFFIDAALFDGRFLLQNMRMPSSLVVFAICPVIWLLCELIVALEVYRHFNSQFILISNWGRRLPKVRFTSENISIA